MNPRKALAGLVAVVGAGCVFTNADRALHLAAGLVGDTRIHEGLVFGVGPEGVLEEISIVRKGEAAVPGGVHLGGGVIGSIAP